MLTAIFAMLRLEPSSDGGRALSSCFKYQPRRDRSAHRPTEARLPGRRPVRIAAWSACKPRMRTPSEVLSQEGFKRGGPRNPIREDRRRRVHRVSDRRKRTAGPRPRLLPLAHRAHLDVAGRGVVPAAPRHVLAPDPRGTRAWPLHSRWSQPRIETYGHEPSVPPSGDDSTMMRSVAGRYLRLGALYGDEWSRAANPFLRSIRVLRPRTLRTLAPPCSQVSTSFYGSATTTMIWTAHQLCDRPDQLHPPLEDELRSFICRSGPSERLQPLDPKADHHVRRSCADAHRPPVGRITCGAFKPRERAFRSRDRLRAPRRSLRVGRACTSSTDPCGSSKRDVGLGRGSPERDSPLRLEWPWSR
jgi:hypothetical protein